MEIVCHSAFDQRVICFRVFLNLSSSDAQHSEESFI